ncbi:hypothetical protein NLI96_g403 [Meripilus lineatus]|uniref:Uncharacterized protein n=1 Tax=Meripilus lineatus TaxID=2056292 RepID=A0AAD5VCM4_9APHY|nr:hypothetical protein NLI96_g403 [Physisporinus lineatus]
MSLEHLALPSPPAGVPPPRSSSPAQMLPTTTATSPTHPNTTSSSTSAPEIRSNQHILPSSIASSPSVDTALAQSSRSASSEALPSPLDTSGTMQTEGDLQIIEALRSKDRLYVLKLGEQMESLITERRQVLPSVPCTTPHSASSFPIITRRGLWILHNAATSVRLGSRARVSTL